MVEQDVLRGVNLVGMEGGYGEDNAGTTWDRAVGPRADKDYPVHSPELIDYFRSKNVAVIRLLFSWERVQSELFGPVPAVGAGYAAYCENLTQVVTYATSLGITVIVEPWQADAEGGAGGARWRGELVGSAGVDLSALADLWTKLATVFRDNGLVEYGLVNEPNGMSTMTWWTIAQGCVDSIRAAGATTRIHVPGNGWSAAGSWTQDWYDTAVPPRSNAYGWLNANGVGSPLSDPLGLCVAEVHVYLDDDAGGRTTGIVSPTIARDRVAVTVAEAAAHGYRIFVAEIGCWAGNPLAAPAWADFVAYVAEQASACAGYAWWAAGSPGWWDDVAANDGGHFSVTPRSAGPMDTVNMLLIENAFR